MNVFESALRENIAVLPGTPFYVDGGGKETIRMNFSNSSEERITIGIERLGRVIRALVP